MGLVFFSFRFGLLFRRNLSSDLLEDSKAQRCKEKSIIFQNPVVGGQQPPPTHEEGRMSVKTIKNNKKRHGE